MTDGTYAQSLISCVEEFFTISNTHNKQQATYERICLIDDIIQYGILENAIKNSPQLIFDYLQKPLKTIACNQSLLENIEYFNKGKFQNSDLLLFMVNEDLKRVIYERGLPMEKENQIDFKILQALFE